MAPGVTALLDPICRAETERMRSAEQGWARLLDHLASAGPSEVGSLTGELGLKPPELRALRSPLERCGVIVGRPIVLETEHGHEHSAVLYRYDQLVAEPPGEARHPQEALVDLLVAGVRAAVVASEAEVPKWFSWRWYLPSDPVELLVSSGRLRRAAGGLVTTSGLQP